MLTAAIEGDNKEKSAPHPDSHEGREASTKPLTAQKVLIPYIHPAYHIGLLLVWIVYLSNFLGWLFASFTNINLSLRIDTGGSLIVGTLVQGIAFVLICWKPLFPLFAIAFSFAGAGAGYQDAKTYVFVTGLHNTHRWLGLLHAVYGSGATISPLVANAIASNTLYWNYYYLVTLSLAVLNTCLAACSFRKCLFRPITERAKNTTGTELKRGRTVPSGYSVYFSSSMWTLRLPLEIRIEIPFFLDYYRPKVKAWLVEYVIVIKKGNPSKIGYAETGFCAGLTLGRIFLADITEKFGERLMILGFFSAAFSRGFVGHDRKIVSRTVYIGGVGKRKRDATYIEKLTKLSDFERFTASIVSAGSAAFPFITGAIGSTAGVKVLQQAGDGRASRRNVGVLDIGA
ncbi:hypothetical protein BGW36DRAFT_428015 [Talaromyces proteolyticus]|uniref:Major facilitator superfamily (MFS) profile domain-containing protein n=1 Tax=Talaromyces proteolyticus TaxID=1131652 RepID=A0AAD4PZH7_9EURO|nr:uncharacterized protein BGW36DRAFT_428015 [Talaromyces proteolyticus]KAH8695991.1 hypothetical protein BGW36DRAFT_428015 [Talaromyces proteolyticus]